MQLITDSMILLATLGHYMQILYLHGISFTLIDAVLFLNMRIVFNNLREKLTSYRNYRKLAEEMNTQYVSIMVSATVECVSHSPPICLQVSGCAGRGVGGIR